MPDSGAGVYSRTNGTNTGSDTWDNDRSDGTAILASRHDTHDEDIATALTNRICKDGQSTPTANIPFGGYQATNLGAATARTSAAQAAQLQDGGVIWGGTAGGTANALTLSLSPAITAYATGMVIRFKTGASANSSATPTLNVNSVDAVNLCRNDGSTGLAVGELRASTIVEAIYDGTVFRVRGWGTKSETWTPTLSASASMTFTSTSIALSRFSVDTGQGLVTYTLQVTGTVGGTPDYDLTFTVPVAMKSAVFAGSANVVNGGVGNYGATVAAQSTTVLGVRLSTNNVWTAGSAAYTVNGQYAI